MIHENSKTERLGKFTYVLAFTLAALHIFNFLNYSTLSEILPFPMIRLVLSVSMAIILVIANFGKLVSYHLRHNYDVYLYCFLAIASIGFSIQPGQSITYSFWLLLSAYMALELAERVKTIGQLQRILVAVIVPAVACALLLNLTLGTVVLRTGRVMGALGTRHVDSAFAMDFILLFFAMRMLGSHRWKPPALLRYALWGLLLLSAYQAVFGLTRSVWLAVLFAGGLYFTAGRATAIRISIVALGVFALVSLMFIVDLSQYAPEVVRDRVELTRQRAEQGEIDPRVVAIERGIEIVRENPLGLGFASGVKAHNTYVNVAIDLGYFGIGLMILIAGRTIGILRRAGNGMLRVFAVGAGGLLIHAFFETQNLPGQGNFYPLLIWFAMTRSTVMLQRAQSPSVSASASQRFRSEARAG